MSYTAHNSRLRHFFSPTQYIRIFVIVNLTTFFIARTFIDTRATSKARQIAAERVKEIERNFDDPEVREYFLQEQRRRQRKPRVQTLNRPSTATATPGSNSTGASVPYPPSLQSRSPPTSSGATITDEMAPKGKTENTKKVAGNAKKAEAAAAKAAVADQQRSAAEEEKWSQGSKGPNAKKQAEADKKAEAAAKKAERDKLLAEEEKSQRAVPKGANKKVAEKKTAPKLDLGALDEQMDGTTQQQRATAINATGIDNALDALSLTASDGKDMKMDRHPERRFKAAYKAYEDRRLPEVEVEHPGLRKNQRIEIIRKEFEKSEENPFNQVGNVRFDATRDEIQDTRRKVREGVENRLGEKS